MEDFVIANKGIEPFKDEKNRTANAFKYSMSDYLRVLYGYQIT
jgi:hypothetical protein